MKENEEQPTAAVDAGRPGQLSEEVVALTVERLRVMAESNRIGLLEALNQGEASVQELADAIGTSHQKVSKHLGVLYGAGMVSRRRQGASVRYSLVDWTGWWVVEQIGRLVESSLEPQRERQAESKR
jgi:DNA-binding transcriptional ArsR family regulator